MSDESQINVEGSVDAAWNSYYRSEKHGDTMSETVDVHDSEGTGSVENEYIPREVDAESLTERQEAIIKAATTNPNRTCGEIGEKLGYDQSGVSRVLRKKAPHWYKNIFKEKGASSQGEDARQRGGYNTREMLSVVHNKGAAKASEVADVVGCTPKTTRKKLTDAADGDEIRIENGYKDYHGRAQVFVSERDTEDSNGSDESVDEVEPTDNATLSVTEPETVEMEWQEESTEQGEGTFTEGDKEALQDLFTKPVNSDSVATDELQAVIEAMKATATNEETVNALCVVEDYL
jgi:G:T/U-mismatch repair DNA glycosylase